MYKTDTMGKQRYKKRADGRYATTILLGHSTDGKPQKLFLAAKTEKELTRKVTEAQVKIQTRQLIKTSNTKLNDYIDSWMKTYKASVSINTKAMYRNIIDHHIKPAIGEYTLEEISGQMYSA